MAPGGAGHPDTVNQTEPDDGLSLPPPLREVMTHTHIPCSVVFSMLSSQLRGLKFESQARQGKWASLLMCI